MKRIYLLAGALGLVLAMAACNDAGVLTVEQDQEARHAEHNDPAALAVLEAVNAELAARNLGIEASAIHYFNIGNGRNADPSLPQGARIKQQPFRWVAGDPRRAADGDTLTYIVDASAGATASGVSAAATEAAIDRAMTTWDGGRCLRKVDVVKRADPGGDITIFDGFFGFGGFGDFTAGDIVNAGWFPPAFFAAAGASATRTLAFSVTFTWTDDPNTAIDESDLNGDNYIDTALNEVYYNDAFGAPGGEREGNPWVIDGALPGIDIETVALHENGHSLGLGHFGPAPKAVMNPIYAGILHQPLPSDHSGMCANYGGWPK